MRSRAPLVTNALFTPDSVNDMSLTPRPCSTQRLRQGLQITINNLIKRIKRVGFGFRNFENYRIRVLLYAGKPNWRVLGSIVVR